MSMATMIAASTMRAVYTLPAVVEARETEVTVNVLLQVALNGSVALSMKFRVSAEGGIPEIWGIVLAKVIQLGTSPPLSIFKE